MRFAPTWLTPDERSLQAEVRAFLAAELPPGSFQPGLGMSGNRDPAFSRKLGARGWLGMSLPREYGGGGRGAVDRFVVVEELLRWGAPLGFHWVADRQSGPNINRFGTPEQRRRFLPGICRGELSFAIGMSEPDSGSDLASLRTTATRTDGGWLLDGTKVWTSGAHACDWLIVLARTSRDSAPQAGLTQFLVDRRAEGVTVRPIEFIDGTADFCEVSLREAFVPDDLVLGTVGGGWAQNTAELAYERGGPDRVLSTFAVLSGWLASGGGFDDQVAREWVGATIARYWVLRNLSLSVARMVDEGRSPVVEAALVKEMATRFEQDVTAAVAEHHGRPVSLDSDDSQDRLLARAILTGPALTIRGGTVEILRNVVARDLARDARPKSTVDGVDPLLVETADRIFADTPSDESTWADGVWRRSAEAGLPWLSLPEAAGGPGGTLADALAVLHLAGQRAVPLPMAETGLLGGWLLAAVEHPLPAGPLTVIPGDPRDTLVLRGNRLTGQAHQVAWAAQADAIVALLPDETGRRCVVMIPLTGQDSEFSGKADRSGGGVTVHRGTNLAGEPRDRVSFDVDAVVAAAPVGIDERVLRRRGALSRIALIAGALAAASELTQAYTEQRVQFGRPVNRFQAVQQHLVTLAQQAVLARMAADLAAAAVAAAEGRGGEGRGGEGRGGGGEGAPTAGGGGGEFEVHAAGVIAAAAAAEGARAAHQAHGAMGMTREYPLQLLTRRLWSWRGEYLSTRDDAGWLGQLVLDAGADRLYPTITGDDREWAGWPTSM